MMHKQSKIFIAGSRGLVGSAITRHLQQQGYQNLLTPVRTDVDLRVQSAVNQWFAQHQPEYVFLAAAKVGGIHANNTYPADFIRDNLAIQTNVIEAAYQQNVKRLLFLGSSCIYPRECPQPMKEEYLLTGPLELTNRPYAIAKIAGIEQCWAYHRQYGSRFLSVMPTNLYGPGDNFDLQTSHVLPALIRKVHEAKQSGSKSITAWGSGTPKREFLYVDDMANACVTLMNLPDVQFDQLFQADTQPPLINIGCGEDISIKDLLTLICEVLDYQGEIVWDADKPDGTLRKLMDISQLKALGWQPEVSLREGIMLTYEWFESRVNT